jgi:glycine betaine/proline transport system permease protein
MASIPVQKRSQAERSPAILRYLVPLALLLLAILILIQPGDLLRTFPEAWNLGLRAPIDDFQNWVIRNRSTHFVFVYFFQPFSSSIDWSLRRVEGFLLALPWTFTIAAVFLLAQRSAGVRTALVASAALLYMGFVGLWAESMQTLAVMGVAVAFALLIGIPLGIWSARSNRVETVLRPILDTMQTMPAFVYLIPVLLFFGVARVPAVVATLIYALPPIIRLTNLGLRQVPRTIIEAAESFGSTRRQLLFKVQLPLAMPTILAGVNQTIMMALGIVVIAALIGAGGLGREVLLSLQRQQVGRGVEAGLAIVALAILLDRLSGALGQEIRRPSRHHFLLLPDGWARYGWARGIESFLRGVGDIGANLSVQMARILALPLGSGGRRFLANRAYWLGSLALLAAILLISSLLGWRSFPEGWQLDLRTGIDTSVRWMRDNLYQIGDLPIGTGPFSDFITLYAVLPLRRLFQEVIPWPLFMLLVAAIAYRAAGWRLALFSAVGLFTVGLLGMWELSMDTLSQTLVAVILALMIALPLGIWAARSNTVDLLLHPLLDVLQTIPSFVFLVPVIMLFNVGRVPGIIASVLYALPPAIRLTNLGIRQVSPQAIEAARAFGATSRQILFNVQLPLALPSIMMGINQTVLMVLAMVIIAGLVGGAGLGLEAVIGLSRNQTGRGMEAGIAIVILAMILDRLTQAWAGKGGRVK